MTVQALRIPGFVDLQVNGHHGVDFSSPALTEEAFVWACRALLGQGTAAFLPTLVSSPVEVYRRNLPLIAGVLGWDEFRGRLLGIHLEGPFISPEPGARGAHAEEFILPPDARLLGDLLDWAGGWPRLLTLAPEMPGAQQLISAAVSRGVVVSIGHSLATAEDLAWAVDAGARALTHLGNGLPNLLPRHENFIWAGLANDDLLAMVIADGHHLPVPILKSIVRAKGVGKLAVVSDASPLAGMPPGHYTTLGNKVILEESGRLHNPDKQCLVGSSATMLQCMNHAAQLGLMSPSELIQVGFSNSLDLLGISASNVGGHAGLVIDEASGTFSVI